MAGFCFCGQAVFLILQPRRLHCEAVEDGVQLAVRDHLAVLLLHRNSGRTAQAIAETVLTVAALRTAEPLQKMLTAFHHLSQQISHICSVARTQ